MNVNPKTGKRLTGDDMAQMAVDHGLMSPDEVEKVSASHHNKNLFASRMGEVTRNLRHEMWTRGELDLDTRRDAADGWRGWR